jgi:hypothetical protein
VRSFLSKITQLTPVAAGLAAGMIAIGVVSIVGGNYAHSVVRSELAPQQIFFPKPAEWPALKGYAGQQVLTGTEAKLYADDQIQADIHKMYGNATYSTVSAKWIAGGMKSATLAAERQTLFMGATLRGTLLQAWGWGKIGSYAILAGILAIVIGSLLFLLPMLNYFVNLKPARKPAPAKATTVSTTAPAGV